MKYLIWLIVGFALVVTIIASLITATIERTQQSYQNDIAFLYDTATKLGFTPNEYLNFYRTKDNGMVRFDVLALLYTTDLTQDEFNARVEGLNFIADYPTEFEGDDFIHYDSQLTALLTMRQKESPTVPVQFSRYNIHYTLQPHGKSWALLPPNRHHLEIQYVSTNDRGDIWAYGDKLLPGKNIVRIDFQRR